MLPRLTFFTERLALRGPLSRVLLILLFLGMLTCTGGLAALLIEDEFNSFPDAFWWSMLRVSDPGYLADDGESGRFVALSLMLSISGTAFLVGGVAAVMTQWLTGQLKRLAEGTQPVGYRGHTVLLGWNDRTGHLAAKLLERDRRARIVVLVPTASEELVHELAAFTPHAQRVVFRSGSLVRPEHLERAACSKASLILMAEADAGARDEEAFGPRWLRVLATLRTVLEDLEDGPRLVLELAEPGLKNLGARLLPQAQFVDGDALVAEALAAEVTQDLESTNSSVLVFGWSTVAEELVQELRDANPVADVTVLVPEGHQADSALRSELGQAVSGSAPGDGVELRFIVSDLSSTQALDDLTLERYERFVLLADRGRGTSERADENTLAVAIALATAQERLSPTARLVVELLDRDSAQIVRARAVDHVVTPERVAEALVRCSESK